MLGTVFKIFLFFSITCISSITIEGNTKNMIEGEINLPIKINDWTRSGAAKKIDSTNIFDYMNGAGELYLAYRFKHLDVYEYTSENNGNILVEIYFMETPDDAFGLLSLDWGGESVSLDQSNETKTKHSVAPQSRALYGKGLLRISADNVYARIIAYKENPSSKEAVFSIGKSIVVNRNNPDEPELLKVLPNNVDSNWQLRNDRITYFHSHLVLNSFYYLSYQNILNLDRTTEAVGASYENNNQKESNNRIQVLFIKYSNQEFAKNAVEHFVTAYLPEHSENNLSIERSKAIKIEDGWMGYNLKSNYLMLVFKCPDEETVQKFLESITI